MALQYNLAKVYEISENDIEFALQIVNLFLQEVPDELKSIKVGIDEKDYSRVYSAAHKIKPSLDLLGMDLAYDENLQIMAWSKSEGKKKEIKETYKSLKERVDLAVKEIKKDFKI
ncbi:Hpt domain-containing protein [Flavobacterium tibetense]|jgi:HPt (histidine-containing phosphotransfer) domain-containing protein|uniref:Histidine kinase n=1 Tax=Flavobacterium tibetense TaxID=2233533 RepID=A0A365P2S6_9FLAO|nr:Hpt domain-containing protein [Flavobacterium tibetense]RBA28816.1 histidine kinase [Flavobacterium tibetense]